MPDGVAGAGDAPPEADDPEGGPHLKGPRATSRARQEPRPASAPPPPAGASSGGPRPQGFTGPGMRQLFDAVLPMQGKERKQFYNQASTGLVVGLGIGGAMLGFGRGGVVGAVIGFGVGATAAGLFVEKRRFYRR